MVKYVNGSIIKEKLKGEVRYEDEKKINTCSCIKHGDIL